MRIQIAHASLEYKDSDKQHTADLEKIFRRAVARRYAWMTGTEAGPGSGNTGEEIIRLARANGYVPWVPEIQSGGEAGRTDCWIVVRKDLIAGKLNKDYVPAIPGSKELEAQGKKLDSRWGPKGLVTVNFQSTNKDLGEVSIAAAHHIHDSRSPAEQPEWDLNEKLNRVLGDWAREQGKGPAIVFYGGDQNKADDQNNQPQGDTFTGAPMTSTWDEIKRYENTGHGTIDVIATYNKDGRVKALRTNALSDREFHLNMDHFFVEGTVVVEPRKR